MFARVDAFVFLTERLNVFARHGWSVAAQRPFLLVGTCVAVLLTMKMAQRTTSTHATLHAHDARDTGGLLAPHTNTAEFACIRRFVFASANIFVF